MKRFKNILLVLTGRESDKSSLKRAADLAKRNNANLGVIDVIEAPVGEIDKLGSRLRGVKLVDLWVKERKDKIDAFLTAAQISSRSTEVKFGVPFLEIIQHVQRQAFDLVIMAAEGKGGLKERLFGTTSLHLMRKCPCPIWIHKPTRTKRYRKIFAAVNPSEPDPIRDALNRKIMELATSMAEMERAELHIVHAWEFVGKSLLVRRGIMTPKDIKTTIADTCERHRQAMERLMDQHPAKEILRKSHLLRGNPGIVIPKCAEKNGANLIVMGTVARQGIAGLLIGNTAEQILERVKISILTVKPEGFITPVQ